MKTDKDPSLTDLVLKFFKTRPDFIIKEKEVLLGNTTGLEYPVDYLIDSEKKEHDSTLFVIVLDFRKSAGIDAINKYRRIAEDVGIKGLIVSNTFSSQAQKLLSKTDLLTMMTRVELIGILATD